MVIREEAGFFDIKEDDAKLKKVKPKKDKLEEYISAVENGKTKKDSEKDQKK